eukprot:TRINITY_DN13804_c0_g1_i2.p4 TRINITY_DN13804_c0_g1~~TRINITY_DN13804_c0_g1_i2.p4  ORF type:complete len:116 (+),score=37.16 TRINITY_DN13804_c0_g1_i2:93-440(+)
MIRRPPRSTQGVSSAASDVYKRQYQRRVHGRMAKEHMPDLVLLDIQMPVMDGEKALKILKEDPRTKALQVIAVTSFAMKGDRERLLRMGFAGYIAKPIDTREFPSLIEGFLSRKT